jgi:uncharacterized membrane protein YoaK (UPF0700 family)
MLLECNDTHAGAPFQVSQKQSSRRSATASSHIIVASTRLAARNYFRMPQFDPPIAGPPKRKHPGQRRTALSLTAIAGFVDAIGYLMLARIYVANMSGNSIAVGFSSAERKWQAVAHHGWPIAAFSLGLIAGGIVAEVQRRRGVRRAVGWSLCLEACFLAAFTFCAAGMLGWHAHAAPERWFPQWLLAGLAAMAMGIQNVTLRAAGAMTVYTTHVTGALTQLADNLVQYALWVREQLQQRDRALPERLRSLLRATPPHPAFRKTAFLMGVWSVYVFGASAGAWSLNRFGAVSATIPLTLLTALAALELVRPSPASATPNA